MVATVQHDLAKAELMAFPLLFLLSLWIFGGLVASALPLVVGGLTISFSLLVLRGVNAVTDLSIFSLNLVTALGLGLAIDYTLLMVSRFRGELRTAASARDAVSGTMRTAGRTILSSSLIVGSALAALLLFPQRFLFSMAVAGVTVALVSAAVGLLVLPAVLCLLGHRIAGAAEVGADELADPRRYLRHPRGRFQDGHLGWLLGHSSQGALDATQPVLLFALIFGLSTDFGMFLLAGVREARDAGADERQAVVLGVGRTGRIATAAALLFCVVMGALATSRIVFIKELGFGTAMGVLIDATVVRAFLVPSLMGLLGKRNWWGPRWLTRASERLALHGDATAPVELPLPAQQLAPAERV